MRLLPHWHRVLRKAWSVKLSVLSALLGALEVLLPLFLDWFPRHVFAAVSIVLAISAAVARVVAQEELRK